MIDIWPIPVLGDNYVWVLQPDGTDEVVVVDPGDGAPVRQTLAERGLHPSAVLLTHHHGDHTAGVSAVTELAACPVFGPATENIRTVDHPVRDGESVDLPGFSAPLEVMEVPGHTAGHVAYGGDGIVLCGDTLFAGGCGRVFEGTPLQMATSLGRLASLNPATLVYCAHEYTLANLQFATVVEPGNPALAQRLAEVMDQRNKGESTVPSTIESELATNPFLRCDQQSVVDAAEKFAGRSLPDAVEVFAVVRSWKDGWRG